MAACSVRVAGSVLRAAGGGGADAGAASAPGSVPVALTVEIAGRYVDVTRFVAERRAAGTALDVKMLVLLAADILRR